LQFDGHGSPQDLPLCYVTLIADRVVATLVTLSMNINEVIQTGNPYYSPIKNISSQLGEIEWRFPFLAQAVTIQAR
jgi:hypothetical protein